MKATVKQLATITFISLLLMVLNVKAEGTETAALNNETIETAMALENWMTDETIWNTNSTIIIDFAPESETELGLEEWMTNTESWNILFSIETETDADLGVENWMISDSNWFILPLEKDSALQMESWMTDTKTWK